MSKKACKRCGKMFATGGPYGRHAASCGGAASTGGFVDDFHPSRVPHRVEKRYRQFGWKEDRPENYTPGKGESPAKFSPATEGQPYWVVVKDGGHRFVRSAKRPGPKLTNQHHPSGKTVLGPYTTTGQAVAAAARLVGT